MRARVLAALFTAVIVVPSALASAAGPRSGDLHATKNCRGFTGDPGSYCVITSSNLPQIEVGTRINYLQPPLLLTPGGTDVILDPPGPGNNTGLRQLLTRGGPLHLLGRHRQVRTLPGERRGHAARRLRLGVGRDLQLQSDGLNLYGADGTEGSGMQAFPTRSRAPSRPCADGSAGCGALCFFARRVAAAAAGLVRVERADLDRLAVERRGLAVDEPLGHRRRAAAAVADGLELVDELGDAEQGRHRRRTAGRESPARGRRRRRARRPATSAVDRVDDPVVEELHLVDPDRVVAPREPADFVARGRRRPRASSRPRVRRRGRRRSGRRSAA